jgi:hypothetical protein
MKMPFNMSGCHKAMSPQIQGSFIPLALGILLLGMVARAQVLYSFDNGIDGAYPTALTLGNAVISMEQPPQAGPMTMARCFSLPPMAR